MELGYLRRLSVGAAGRFNFGESERPAAINWLTPAVDRQLENLFTNIERKNSNKGRRYRLEEVANSLHELAGNIPDSGYVYEVISRAAREIMRCGY